MSQTQSAETTNLTRRQAMRGLVGGAAAVTVGSTGINYSTRNARALAPAIPVVGFAAGAAIAYLMDPDTTPYLGDSRDYSGYTGADALHQEITAGVKEMQSADERVMTSIQNNLTNSQNVALAKGKAAIIEKMNAGASESEAQTAMQEAIDGYYATIQQNIVIHADSQVRQFQHMIDSTYNHADLLPENVFNVEGNSNPPAENGTVTLETTLVDGSTVTYAAIGNSGSKDALHWAFDETNDVTADGGSSISVGSYNFLSHIPFDGSSEIKFFNNTDLAYKNAYDAVITERDSVNSALSGFVTDVYANWSAGEIPTEDLVDPITASTELRQNYDGYQAQGAHAAMLGIPTTADQAVHMTIQGTDENGDPIENDVTADIYTEYVPTDADGNEVGFQSGETYDPSSWDKPLYIAYEYVDSDGNVTSDFVQLENEFTINSITDKDGNEVDSFQTESRNNQTADVSKLQEELDQIREEQQRLQEESQDDVVGGGGGFLSDIGTDSNSTIIAVVAVILVAFGLLGNN